MRGSSKPRKARNGTKTSTKSSTTGKAATGLTLCAVMLSAGCNGVSSGLPAHCIGKDEYSQGPLVTAQKVHIFQYDEATGSPARFGELAYRIDYLEAKCRGINAFRGEKPAPPPPPEIETE